MSDANPDLEVRHARDGGRYELWDGDALIGVADYREQGEVLVFPHTEIAPGRRGAGLGDVLVEAALEDVRRRGHRVVPTCWFVVDFIRSRPAYQDLLADPDPAHGGAGGRVGRRHA